VAVITAWRIASWRAMVAMGDELLSKLKALAVFAFCAEITRLPGHCAPLLRPWQRSKSARRQECD
jgi:hypothetical protein